MPGLVLSLSLVVAQLGEQALPTLKVRSSNPRHWQHIGKDILMSANFMKEKTEIQQRKAEKGLL